MSDATVAAQRSSSARTRAQSHTPKKNAPPPLEQPSTGDPPTTSTMSTPEFPEIATPGQPLAPVASYTLGTCVHIFNDRICASIVGQPSLSAPTTKSESKQILSVLRPSQSGSSGKQEDVALTNLLPQVGNNVLARVTRINPRQATVAIFVVGDTVCNDEFQGIIRCGNSRIRRGWARN